jgi:tetratricopeptide (TPR) repeat protein
MGRNAAKLPTKKQMKELPDFLLDFPGKPPDLKPGAEECFRQSLALAPDNLPAHEELFKYLEKDEKFPAAAKAARETLRRFPDHVETLRRLGTLCLKEGKSEEALDFLQRALQGNPLDRSLRQKVIYAHMLRARDLAQAGSFDEARAEYRASHGMESPEHKASVCWRWAAAELLAGDAERAEELLQEARQRSGSALTVAFGMVTEVGRMKLGKPHKQRFQKEWTDGLQAAPDPAAAAGMVVLVATLESSDVTYHGFKAHSKKVLDYLKKAQKCAFTEKQLEDVCNALWSMQLKKLTQQFAGIGQRKYPQAPLFPFLEAQTMTENNFYGPPVWKVQPLLQKAERLAQALPLEDERRAPLLKQIAEQLQALKLLNPFSNLADVFGDDFGFGAEDDFEDADFDE